MLPLSLVMMLKIHCRDSREISFDSKTIWANNKRGKTVFLNFHFWWVIQSRIVRRSLICWVYNYSDMDFYKLYLFHLFVPLKSVRGRQNLRPHPSSRYHVCVVVDYADHTIQIQIFFLVFCFVFLQKKCTVRVRAVSDYADMSS